MTEIVAEISGNHGGSLPKALELIHEAAMAGCDYVKFQYYLPKDMPDCAEHKDMYEKLYVPHSWLPKLFEQARYRSIGLFASVFSVRAVQELAEYDISYVKLASPESTRLPLMTYEKICLAVPGHVDIIASTGPADFNMMRGLTRNLLYCPSGHPPDLTIEDMNYYTLAPYMGLSDHTPGCGVPAAFMRIVYPDGMLKTRMIEKHLKLKDDKDCVDAEFSADPDTMKQLCRLAHRG